MNVSLMLMTVIVQEWLTVLIALAVSVVPVKPAILEVEEIIRAKVTSEMKDSRTVILNCISYRH